MHSNAASSVAFSRYLPNTKFFLSQSHLPGPGGPKAKEKQILGVGAVHASQSDSEATNPTTNASEKWLLEPIGQFSSVQLHLLQYKSYPQATRNVIT